MPIVSRRLPTPPGIVGGLLLLAVAAAPLAAEDPPAGAVEVVPLEGAPRSGRFVGLAADGLRFVAQDSAVEALAGDDLEEVRFAAAGPVARPQGTRLRAVLVGGEVLVASSWGPAADGLWLASESFGRVEIAFDLLRSLAPLPVEAGPCHDPAGRTLPKPGSDLALLAGGDELVGTLLEAVEGGLVLEGAGGRKRSIAWGELLVVHVDNPCLPLPTGRTLEVETRGGDVLLATGAAASDAAQTLAVPLASDAARTARVPLAALAALRWRGVKAVDLTALDFTSEHRPLLTPAPGSLTEQYLARERGARVGRRPRGCPLRLDGRSYVHGLAVHSGSTVRVPLAGGFRRFTVRVGIDDEAKEEGRGRVEVPGDVDARVLGDGKVLWEARGVTGLQEARRVGPLDVSGVQELVLEVAHGGHDEVLDRVTWADPLLVR